jgi:ribosomal protein S18 acetylase RimI-like enzyme
MAVDDDYQNQGVGSSILIRLEGFAQTNNLRICWLYAREEAIKFYSKNGYAVKGESKSELSELKHKRMEKSLNQEVDQHPTNTPQKNN